MQDFAALLLTRVNLCVNAKSSAHIVGLMTTIGIIVNMSSAASFANNRVIFRLYVAEQDDIVCSSRKDNPLSNFFPSDLKVFGQTFPSAEHAFQHVKSIRSGDLSRAEAIRKSDTALDAKRFGSQVLESDAWISSKDTVMSEILETKLQQCAKFKEALSNVKKTDILVESTWDSYWGSGLNLNIPYRDAVLAGTK